MTTRLRPSFGFAITPPTPIVGRCSFLRSRSDCLALMAERKALLLSHQDSIPTRKFLTQAKPLPFIENVSPPLRHGNSTIFYPFLCPAMDNQWMRLITYRRDASTGPALLHDRHVV